MALQTAKHTSTGAVERVLSLDGMGEGWEIVAGALETPQGASVELDETTGLLVESLTAAKHKQWQIVKASREAAQFGGCQTALGVMDTDAESQAKITGTVVMATLLGEAFSIPWTMQNNVAVVHNASQMIAAGVAVGIHVATCHGTGSALRAAINAAATVEDVEAVTWPSV